MPQKPALIIMAAGMGSRYGGLKQMEPVTPQGEWLLDFSAFDALRAGFGKIIFVIARNTESDFRRLAGARIERHMEVSYCVQDPEDLPAGLSLPADRTKPWGTGHALYACRREVPETFAVINSDDFYGRGSFVLLHDYLNAACAPGRYGMVGFELENTLTEHGSVSRGVCTLDGAGSLSGIVERTCVEARSGGAAFSEDGGLTWTALPAGTTVSMNMWGFHRDFMGYLERALADRIASMDNPAGDEFYLPFAVESLRAAGGAEVRVLRTDEKWFGMTYRQDGETLRRALADKKRRGEYPERLWEGAQ